MKVLVTGATGFVGSGIVRALRWHGYSVLALVRDAEKAQRLKRAGVETAIGDMRDPTAYQGLVSRVSAVIHSAQIALSSRWTRREISAMHAADATMTQTLANACLDQEKTFIYSSGGLTHCCDGDAWINECSPPNPCLAAAGHAAMVAWLSDMHQRRGLRSVVLSPGFVYGVGGFLQMTVDLMLRRHYFHLGNPGNFWSMVHVDDLGEAYVKALEHGRFGESYFLCDDLPLRREEVIGHLADALDLPRVRRVAGWLAGLALGGPMIEAVTSSIRLRNKKARRELRWQPCYENFPSALPGVLEEILARVPRLQGAVARLHSA